MSGSIQRRRGQEALVYKLKEVTDSRGNKQLVCDMTDPTPVRAAFIPQRSSRAEVPGQQVIDIVRMIVDHRVPDVAVWNRVRWNGHLWDIVAPPSYRHGTRHTRHYSVDLRKRPDPEGA